MNGAIRLTLLGNDRRRKENVFCIGETLYWVNKVVDNNDGFI